MTFHDLSKAQQITLPTREEMLARAPSVSEFWYRNTQLFESAWNEWQHANAQALPILDESLFDPKLKQAVEQAWQNPNDESVATDLWEEVSPGVYQTQFFDPAQLPKLREFLELAAASEIPTRPPYGLVLNRHGAMLDPRSEGYLAAPTFQDLYSAIMNRYLRPIARALFPEIVGYDSQTFGFTIRYEPTGDTSIRMHTDGSSVTLNINMNLPHESFTGSEVDFHNPETGGTNRISFKPGVAMLHRGSTAHAALPITSGTRTNMVLWLLGKQGQTPYGSQVTQPSTAEQRWTASAISSDGYAPF